MRLPFSYPFLRVSGTNLPRRPFSGGESLFTVVAMALALFAAPVVYAETAPTTAAALSPAPPVSVRAATHGDFDRVVFDWPRDVKFALQNDGPHHTLTFDAAANMQFTRDVTTKLTRANGFSATAGDANHSAVSFTTAADANIKAFVSGTSVVVDIMGKTAPHQVPVATPTPAPAQVSSTTSSLSAASPATPAAPPRVVPPASATSAQTTAASATDHPEALAPNSSKVSSPQAVTAPTKTTAVPEPVSPPSPPLTSADTSPVPLAAKTPPKVDTATLAPTTSAPPLAVPPSAVKNSASSLPMPGDTPLLIATLDPHVAARAAIYQRAGYGYVIFERKLSIAPDVLEGSAATHIDLQPFDLPKNSGYRFPLPHNTDLLATRDDTAWKIFLTRPQSDMPVTTALVAQPDFALGPRLLLPLPDAPEPIHMTDPVVGDDLIVVPLEQSEAFNTERHMADFTILAAAQGLVIKPLTDKMVVHAVSDGIEITANGGLLLSRAIDTGESNQSSSKARAAEAGKSIFDFATWAGKSNETFTQTRQRLQQTIVDVPEAERNRARLELARFYFANGNGEEALGLLNMLAKDVPDLKTHADFLALLGAAEILANRPDDGLRDLSSPFFVNQPEIELWQAIGLAEQRDWQNAEEKFSVTESILTGYPEPFFSRYMVLAIESALATGHDHEASDWLNYVSTMPHRDQIAPALAYLHGAIDVKANRATAAEESWKEAEATNDQLYKVRSELALVDLGVSTKSLTPAQAADRLEALRFAWRGDDLEVDILRRLGEFYIQAKNVKAGLNTLSQAVALYPSSPMAGPIRAEMATVFHDVFLGDLGKKLSPLDALTLYQQYRDLMPTGKDGDVVMHNLSERLVSIDLLDQAASILEDLVKGRLQGDEKDHSALRLAGIRLLDHQPDQALAALDLLGSDTLSASEQTERTLLRARALSELKRNSDALALLKDMSNQGARMLRADIAMHTEDWAGAASALMELVGPPPSAGKRFSDDQVNWLVNAAIAYALAQDQVDLDKLAIDYGAVMAATTQSDTFRMLTQPEKSGQMRDLAQAQSQISQVDMFQSFLNNYRTAPTDNQAEANTPAAAPTKP